MKIVLVADGRSPITRSWIRGLEGKGHILYLISSYPCIKPEGISELFILPLAFSGVGRSSGEKPVAGADNSPRSPTITSKIIQQFRLIFLALRYYLGPLSILTVRIRYNAIIQQIHPDLVQALRIPFEGMLASFTPSGIAVIVNSWGNDFTLHGRGSILMEWMTRRAVRRADGFCADCQRDIRLAKEWGLRSEATTLFAPGNGGLDLAVVDRITRENPLAIAEREQNYLVINPRGIRPAYVRNDIFFRAIPQVMAVLPQTHFICTSMRGQSDAEKWVRDLHLEQVVTLLGTEPQEQLWQRYLSCNVLVSPAIHDGTPNSVLEGMAYGCLPVVGKIESLEEWITDEENGLLVNPNDPASVAMGIITALMDRSLQQTAREINQTLVEERADYKRVMEQVDQFYKKVVASQK